MNGQKCHHCYEGKMTEMLLIFFTLFCGSLKRAFSRKSSKGGMTRLMTMSPLYPCGKPCSTGTHNETVKKLALFSAIIIGIVMESRAGISIPLECFQFFNRIENSNCNNSNSQISQSDRYYGNRGIGA